jgi:hypothetical protein
MVLSQDVSTRKGKKPQKPPASSRDGRSKSKRKPSQGDSPFSFTSSPTHPQLLPPSSLPFPYNDDDITTEMNSSDAFDLSYLNDDSDLDPDSVSKGEYCFAKDKAADTVYWPAKVLEVKRPGQRKGKGI